MKVKVIKDGIYGKDGPVEIGSVLEVKSVPDSWKAKVTEMEGNKEDDSKEMNLSRADMEAQLNTAKIKFDAKATDKELWALLTKE